VLSDGVAVFDGLFEFVDEMEGVRVGVVECFCVSVPVRERVPERLAEYVPRTDRVEEKLELRLTEALRSPKALSVREDVPVGVREGEGMFELVLVKVGVYVPVEVTERVDRVVVAVTVR